MIEGGGEGLMLGEVGRAGGKGKLIRDRCEMGGG